MSGRLGAMKRATLSRVLTVVSLATLGPLGCGLISSDVTKVTYPLPTRTYSFNSATWGVPATTTVAVPCGGSNPIQDCCNPPAPLPKPMCAPPTTTLACEASVCTFKQLVSIVSAVNLKDVQQLSTASKLANVSLQSLDYAVTTNTLNVAVPPLTLYLAPMGVTDPNSAQAVKFGTVPSIAAMQMPTGSVQLEPDSDATFATFAADLSVPFGIIAATTVSVPSGSATPQGALSVDVTGTFAAKLAL
jgi:hypothetical protein